MFRIPVTRERPSGRSFLILSMESNPHPFDLPAARRMLNSFGHDDVRYLPEVPSTNAFAAALRPGDWRHGTAIVTDHQTSGRGRRGRGWTEPAGTCVLISVVLRPPPARFLSHMVFVASLAVLDAIEATSGLRPALKWPNDVHVGGRKLSGILIENHANADHRVVVGVGINVNVPQDTISCLHPDASSILAEIGKPVEREVVVAALLRSLEVWYGCLTREPDAVFAAWRSRLDTPGSSIDVHDSNGVWSGVAIDVQPDGGLIVERSGGERRPVYAADVSIRRRNSLQTP